MSEESQDIYNQRDQILKDMKEKLDKIYTLLLGDGTTGNPGIMMRVDRLEQWKQEFDKSTDRAWQWRLGLAVPIVILLIERAMHYAKGVH